jgi:prepilin peptidase CpaA
MLVYHSHFAGLIVHLIIACVLAIAVVTDVSKRKIYNWLTFPAIAAGFVLNSLFLGGHGFLDSLAGFAIGSIWMILLIVPGSSAGDVKLFWAVGALMGFKFTLWAMLCSVLCGAVHGIAYAMYKGQLSYTIKNALVGGHVLAVTKDGESLKGMASTSKVGKIPSAPSIALGCIIAAYLILKSVV